MRISESDQNVDHVLEVQLLEHVTLPILSSNRELVARFRNTANEAANLNVTARKVNQAKRGPFTAVLNRLRKCDGGLRQMSVEHFARIGRARWLVDGGEWANIEGEIVLSYEAMAEKLSTERLTRAQTTIMEATIDSLHTTLEKIQIL